ncbi:CheY chemotaxis protein or a CheY-like REC (receiver) domain [Lishizhenia tianjinensis]|uniref:CheY chemotaxis protein or a CheY-like REC (Receiver) domain n=1 Tax=Lishizhenia tianjinensis TaxID=477690 RepID=A0A1I7BPF7_9FLAO|nr:response regulator [Lishizhenia tianjinensis]SFT89056.1 CheY chemotaxis protein or a CheY-like REC (receiver) domain [Lishizhenia tianjinensis]
MQLDRNKILLIDDNEITNFCNKDIIGDLNIFNEILAFTSPGETLDYLKSLFENKKDIPAIFIVDVKMPEMDGFELIDEIDELFEEHDFELMPLFFILTTSNHKRDYEQFDKTPQAKEYITKPLSEEKLKEMLSKFSFLD